MTKQFVMMCGAPCSGKSTSSKKFEDQGFVRVSTDDYIEAYAAAHGLTYGDVFEKLFKSAEAMMYQALETAIREKKNIIWDQTNLSSKSRRYKMSKIPSSYEKIVIFMDTPLDVLLERNKIRFQETGKNIPDNVFRRMLAQAEIPTENEGWDSIEIVSV